MPLNYKILGSGEPLVILHGLFGSLDNWQTLAQEWAQTRMCVLLDLRNHGRSPHFETHSVLEMAADVAEFLEDNWMHEVDMLGHSMGGKVAMQFALTYPERLRKLIVVDMGVRSYERGHDDIFGAMRALPLSGTRTRAELEEHLRKDIPQKSVRQFLLKSLKRKGADYAWKLNLEVLEREYAQILVALAGEAWAGETLFIRGAKSDYISDADWSGIQHLFPAAQLLTVAEAGHWVHAEQPEALRVAVKDFLTGPVG